MKKKTTIMINVLIGVLTFLSWGYMVFFSQSGNALSNRGLNSLKYFTVLSNLFNGVVCLLYAYWLKKDSEITVVKKTWKLVATSAVGLTFVTVMAFLGPLYGYPMMFKGANLWMHFVLPVGSFITFLFLERGTQIPFRNTFYAMIPAAVYSICYVTNIAIKGKGQWPDSNDFYGFLTWGNLVGGMIACTICFAIWIIAVLLFRIGKMNRSK